MERRAGSSSFGQGRKRLSKGEQLTFGDRAARTKAGRFRKKPGPKPAARPNVRHRTRPEHDERHPVHITLRAFPGLPSFRSQTMGAAFEKAFRKTRRDDFRIVEFSVQTNHVHIIAEGAGTEAIANGMKSFSVRANRLVNAVLKRAGVRPKGRGRVWSDRYHRRDLASPRAVRNALVYCINNYRKHQNVRDGRMNIDPYSSARWFRGWVHVRDKDDGERPTPEPTQPLLVYLWQRHGLIHPGEAPRLPS